MKVLAIIPARGGSKSIPRKNLKLLAGKPLLSYPIELAKSVPEIDRIIVSTEDEEIASVAKRYGAEVPFIRPNELAQDETPTLPVLQHCVNFLEKTENYKPDVIIHLFATNPFLTKENVQKALQMLAQDETLRSVVSVEEDWGRFWKLDEEKGQYVMLHPKTRVNRQYYKPLYKENGAIYFSRYGVVITENRIVDDDSVKFLVMKPNELVDIDTPEDWEKAEEMLKTKKIF